MTETNLQSKPISEIRNKKSKKVVEEVQDGKQFHTIRILLVFAKDGATHADQIITGMINFTHEVPVMKEIKKLQFIKLGFSNYSCRFLSPE